MSDQKYFQFKLCCLTSTMPWPDLLGRIIDNCIQDCIEREPMTFEEAQVFLRFKGGDAKGTKQSSSLLRGYLNTLPVLPACNTLVRIRDDLLWDAKRGDGMGERNLRVLIALYSAVGENPFRRVTVEQISMRAVGCASRELFAWYSKQRSSKPSPLTPKQIRGTLDELHHLGFFARTTWRHRQTYYSHRLPLDQLRALIEKQKLPALARKAAREQDAQWSNGVIERIKAAAATAATGGSDPRAT